MIVLVTQAEIEKRMALGATPAAKPAFDSALVAATLRIQAELETVLDAGSDENLFFLDGSQHGVVPNGFFKLRLKNGFVRGTPVVTVGDSPSEAVTAIADAVVDSVRGIVAVKQDYQGKFVKVSYQYGFNEGDTIPAVLKEAALAYMPSVFDFSAVGGNKKTANPGIQAAMNHAMMILAPVFRKKPFCLNPVY